MPFIHAIGTILESNWINIKCTKEALVYYGDPMEGMRLGLVKQEGRRDENGPKRSCHKHFFI